MIVVVVGAAIRAIEEAIITVIIQLDSNMQTNARRTNRKSSLEREKEILFCNFEILTDYLLRKRREYIVVLKRKRHKLLDALIPVDLKGECERE